jgi:hypothetical protein
MRDLEDRFSEQYDPSPAEYPSPVEYADPPAEYDYPPDGVGALPAGVRIRCEPCGATFTLYRGPAICCPHCGCSLEAR